MSSIFFFNNSDTFSESSGSKSETRILSVSPVDQKVKQGYFQLLNKAKSSSYFIQDQVIFSKVKSPYLSPSHLIQSQLMYLNGGVILPWVKKEQALPDSR
ncbi:hypothetical protein BgiBS90_019612 [Biomphalaria glabrata]|nr:hypothetical protein BgiBS90_019612 [Biomphalaria glabrata]